MNQDYVSVPLKSNESTLPVYGVSVPQFAFANISLSSTKFHEVRIDDSSDYESVPMRWVDTDASETSWE